MSAAAPAKLVTKKVTPAKSGQSKPTTKKHAIKAAPSNSGNISDRALLVALSVSKWNFRQTDKTVTKEVADLHQAEQIMGRYRKNLVNSKDMLPVTSAVHKLRDFHWTRTLPWDDAGYRVISSAGYLDYLKGYNELKAEVDKGCEQIFELFGDIKADAKTRLGTLFNPADYPTMEELKAKYGVSLSIRPVPSGKDFRVELGSDETAIIRKAIEDEAKKTTEAAMREVGNRIKEVVSKAVERLKAYNVTTDGKVENAFRDSIIANIIETLDILPSINITGDKQVVAFASEIRAELTKFSPVVLRDDSGIRKAVITKADDILNRMNEYFA